MKKMISIVALFLLIGCTSSQEVKETKITENTEIIIEEDDSLFVDDEEIIQDARATQTEITYLVTYDLFNNETDREVIKEEVIEEGRPTIKKVGTKELKISMEVKIDEELEVIYQEDPNYFDNEEVVISEGVLGQIEEVYEEVYIKEKLLSRQLVDSKVLVEAQPRVIKIKAQDTPIDVPIDVPIVYDNTDLSWWYQIGTPKASIPSDVSALIAPFNVLWQIETNEKVVYLTIDEGYEYKTNTTQILDTLKAKNVSATFFVTGSYVDRNPNLVNRMFDEGHQVANHTIHHYRAAPTINESVQKYISDVVDLEAKVNGMTKFHRPPEGGYSQQSLAILDELGYKTVFWSFAYRDWLTDDQPDPEWAKSYILDNIHPGSILLLHAVSDTNTAILGDVIEGIWAKGYRIDLLTP